MNLIALCCTKCGSPLDFNGALICNCPSCGTPHVLVDSGGNLWQSVSFLPYVTTPGKMERSLKMQLVAKLREVEALAVSASYRFEESCIEIVSDEVAVFRETIFDDDEELWIGKVTVTPVVERGIFKRFLDPYVSIKRICTLWVIPVEMNRDGHSILAGHRIRIRVANEAFEKDVDELSQKIKDWFGIVPEVSLERI